MIGRHMTFKTKKNKPMKQALISNLYCLIQMINLGKREKVKGESMTRQKFKDKG
jgi:hypothetical protein